MSYDFNAFKGEVKKTEEWLVREYAGIRTGRAAPAVLDSVRAEAYGSMMPLNQLATISVEDARVIRIAPWDASAVKPIEKAIQTSGLGLSVVVDEKGLRIMFPELTAERRQDFVKMAKTKLEEARVRVRSEREKSLKDMEKKDLGEDETFRLKHELQKLVDESSAHLEKLFEKKEKEITE